MMEDYFEVDYECVSTIKKDMWIFKGKEFKQEDIPEGAIGFVYEMNAVIDGKMVLYIGKKNFYCDRKTKLAKKDLSSDKRKKTYKRVRKFNYQEYYSSNEVLKEARKNGINIDRKILDICYSKLELSYLEVKLQFNHNVLEDDNYLNGNILGKFYKKVKK
jgi:hypothetical protein